jgi:hypothetical protein
MSKLYVILRGAGLAMFFVIALLFAGCAGCSSGGYFEVDVATLQEKIYEPTATKKHTLDTKVSLYVDYSTCVKLAVEKSDFFSSIRPRITGLQQLTMYKIEGSNITLFSSDNASINQELNKIKEIDYANIGGAVEQICNANQQAILITDCEYWTKQEGERTDLTYMKDPIVQWLNKGFSIYVLVEPYKETSKGTSYDKKLFYFFFTDDKITDNIYTKIIGNVNTDQLSTYKFTNSDMKVIRNKDMVDNSLVCNVDDSFDFDYIEIENKWEDIQKYIMEATDDDGNLIPGGTPFIKGLKFTLPDCYVLTTDDINIKVANITKTYQDSFYSPNLSKPITDGIFLDKKAMENGEIAIKINDKILDFLSDEDGNLIRIDFVIKSAKRKNVPEEDFVWKSTSKPGFNISVQESINQALEYASPVNQIIHTIFIKTAKY